MSDNFVLFSTSWMKIHISYKASSFAQRGPIRKTPLTKVQSPLMSLLDLNQRWKIVFQKIKLLILGHFIFVYKIWEKLLSYKKDQSIQVSKTLRTFK